MILTEQEFQLLQTMAPKLNQTVDQLLSVEQLVAVYHENTRLKKRLVELDDRYQEIIRHLEQKHDELINIVDKVAFEPINEDINCVRHAATLFGFKDENTIDKSRLDKRFKELTTIFHPDTKPIVDGNRTRMLIQARKILLDYLKRNN